MAARHSTQQLSACLLRQCVSGPQLPPPADAGVQLHIAMSLFAADARSRLERRFLLMSWYFSVVGSSGSGPASIVSVLMFLCCSVVLSRLYYLPLTENSRSVERKTFMSFSVPS